MKKISQIGWTLILLVNVLMVEGDVVCTFCDHALTIDDCIEQGTITCKTGEQCFLEKLTTPDLEVNFHAGCRSTQVCNIMAQLTSSIGRRDLSRQSRNLVNCAQCCNDPMDSSGSCNSRLCGEKPTSDNSIHCLACDNLVSGPAACKDQIRCPDKQICATSIHVVGNQIKYKYNCEEYHVLHQTLTEDTKTDKRICFRSEKEGYSHICQAFISNGIQHRAQGLSGLVICDACCLDNACNREDCYQLSAKMNATFAKTTIPNITPKPTTPSTTPKPTTPSTTPKPTTPSTTPKPTTPSTTPKPTTPSTTPKPTTPSTTPKPTTPSTTPKPTTPSTTPKPTTPSTTPKPTTPSTTPKPTTPSTTPKPTTPSTTPKPTTPSTTPVPTTAAPTVASTIKTAASRQPGSTSGSSSLPSPPSPATPKPTTQAPMPTIV